MQNINTSRYLECLIGLLCRIVAGSAEMLIIEVSPAGHLVLLGNDGNLTHASPWEICLTQESREMLTEKMYHQNRRAMK